jgi:uncharacterized membrane-anchored protein
LIRFLSALFQEIEGFANTVYLRTGIKSVDRLKTTLAHHSFEGKKAFLDNFDTSQKARNIIRSKKQYQHAAKQLKQSKEFVFYSRKGHQSPSLVA